MKTLKVLMLMLVMVQGLNGYEDREEPSTEEHRSNALQKVDKNEDERISLEEAFGGMKDNFKEHDLDDNGFIEGTELDTLPKELGHEIEEDLHKHILQRHDKDGDNKISLEEAKGGMKRNFKRHDLNKDGYIAGDELDTLPKHKRDKHDKHFNDRR